MATVDDLLASRPCPAVPRHAESRGRRQRAGALLVDLRIHEQREADGTIPGADVISLNHLEWRLDPTSASRIPRGDDHDVEVVLCCDEGYCSSLAAARLHDLGLHRATDMIGGFQAWRAGWVYPVEP